MKSIVLTFCFITTFFQSFSQIKVETKRNENKNVDFNYVKTYPGSYYLKLIFKSLDNATEVNYEDFVHNTKGRLFTLRPIDDNISIGYSYSYKYWVAAECNLDSTFAYLIPFKKNTNVRVIYLGNAGEKFLDQESPDDWIAYGFITSENKIFASRKGIVVNVKNEYASEKANEYKYTSKTNAITIEHEDGTYARYNGFKKDHIDVLKGDVVYPGTFLGVVDLKYREKFILKFQVYTIKVVQKVDEIKTELKYLEPFFYTEKGTLKLENKEAFISSITDDLIFTEMSKREIKKYQKNSK